jgi:hypothetical protein
MERGSLLNRTLSAFERLPGWLRPAVAGALILFLAVVVRLVFALPRIIAGEVGDLQRLPTVFVAAMGAGAAGGFAYSFVGKPLLRVPLVGRYLTGIVCIAGYLTPLLLWGDRIFGGGNMLSFSKASDVVVWAFCVLLFGIVMGRTWFDSPGSAKSTPSLGSHEHIARDKGRYPWYLRGDSSIDALQRRQYDRMAASLRRTRRVLRVVAVGWALAVLAGMAIGRRVTLSGVLFLIFTLVVFALSYWPIRDFDRDLNGRGGR